MGSALVRGILRAGMMPPEKVAVSDADPARAGALARELGVQIVESNARLAADSEYVILAVKPGQAADVIGGIAGSLAPEQALVSIVAGFPLARVRSLLGASAPALFRVMPNTPALVGAAATAVAPDAGAPDSQLEELKRLLSAVGEVFTVTEDMMDAVTGLSGSGPAFVFVMIEALADGGVAMGLPRSVAQRLAAQTVFGAAKMVLETGQHPGALKDAVASPGGTTMAGLAELERAGARSAVISAVAAATARSKQLSKPV
jgi:pyrroline-5-carboxylate reductase